VSLTLTSLRNQDLTLTIRHGIQSITAPPGVLINPVKPGAGSCELRLPEAKPVSLHMKLGTHRPSDWIETVAAR
jgi:hypothetical protein